MKKHKLFITFEGGEGTGKSTTAQHLAEKLKENGHKPYITREPGGQGLSISEDIRNIIMDNEDISPITELLLFNASRREHVDKIINPKLEEGYIVISDRFIDSTLIYQGVAKNVDPESIKIINKIAIQETEPNIVFVFDLDPAIGRERIEANNRETNRFDKEGIEFHNKIREAYLDLCKTNPNKYIVLDASKPTEELVEIIYNKIKEYES